MTDTPIKIPEINLAELEALHQWASKKNFNNSYYIMQSLMTDYSNLKRSGATQASKPSGKRIDELSLLRERRFIVDVRIQDAFLEYFLQHNNFNLNVAYEALLVKDSYSPHLLEGYVRHVKKGNYIPSDDSIKAVIEKYDLCTNVFSPIKLLFNLAVCCHDNRMAAECFELVAQKNRGITTLDLEEVKKIWTKRFAKTQLDYGELAVTSKLFSQLEDDKDGFDIGVNEGHFLRFEWNLDKVSQKNRLNVRANYSVNESFFRELKKYMAQTPEVREKLSIDRVSYESKELFCVTVFYHDEQKKDMLNALMRKMIAYTANADNQKTIEHYTFTKNFACIMGPLINHHVLDNQLAAQDDKISVKKRKI